MYQWVKNLYGQYIEGRSPKWPKERAEWLKEHDFCRACGRKDHLQVHHKVPFHIDKSKELDRDNFITLCENTPENDHLVVGHNGNWKNYNPNVEEDCDKLLATRMKQNALS